MISSQDRLAKQKIQAEIQKLQVEAELLQRSFWKKPEFKIALTTSALSATVGIAALIYGVIQVKEAEVQNKNLEKYASEVTQQRDVLLQANDDLSKKVAPQIQESRAAVTEKIDEATRKLLVAGNTYDYNYITNKAAKQPNWDDYIPSYNGNTAYLELKGNGKASSYATGTEDTGNSTPTLYVQIAADFQRERWNAIRPNISKEGFDVPAIQNVGDKAPNESQLRYFHNNDQEKAIAEKLVKSIEMKTGVRLIVKYVAGFVEKVKANTFEVWLSKDAK